MKLRKRYFLLIFLAIAPFYKFIHPENYCFGDVDLVIIGGFMVLFAITFLVIFFNNLYLITIKKELFNFRPVIITVVFLIALYTTLGLHDKNIFQEKIKTYKGFSKEKDQLEINLFDDNTFELKIIYPKSYCVEKGEYSFKNDTLLLDKYNKVKGNIIFDDMYVYNDTQKSLNPIYSGLPVFVSEK
ncbi:hypothetical protein [Polaribacter sp. Hel_I_88]|uniref:hypothetical protein n=1 Tax=Polaribacter sp. Hel_I_88 TaxID=1250006 RepID=UPI00047D59DC|nr:hypothetical protein [Polaribacter sp. Hel_I_88]